MNVARSWTSNRVVVYAFSPFRWLQNVEPDYVHCKAQSPDQLCSTSASYSKSQVQVAARRPSILTETLRGVSQANAKIV